METKVTQFTKDDVKPGKMSAVFLGRTGPVSSPKGQMIFWEFQVEQDNEVLTVTGVSSDSFSHDSRCKAMRWAKLLDPAFNDEAEEWDDIQAVGNIIGVEVVYREDGDKLISTVKDLFKWLQKSPAT